MQPPDSGRAVDAEAYRMASLERILNDAAAAGSTRKVTGAFVEALGVWAGVRVRIYAADTGGGFFHYVSPVGAPSSSIPTRFDAAEIPGGGAIVRLSRDEAERVGLASEPGDRLVLKLSGTGIVAYEQSRALWLLVFSGTMDETEQRRLAIYADMLRRSLDNVYETASNRAIAAVPQQQPGEHVETIDTAAQTALAHLSAAVSADQAALSVTTVTGIRALAVGQIDLLPTLDEPARTDRLVLTSTHTASFMTLVAARRQPPFMAFERAVLEAAVPVFHPWIQAALLGSTEGERRRQFKPLENVFDQLAAKAVTAGQDASVIVMSVEPALATPELLQSWLGSIRVQLRAGDFAGILSDSEIAVLLCDTSADQAAAVSARVKQIVEADESAGVTVHPAVGTTTRSPKLPFVGSLVRAAREGAAAR